VLYTNVVQRRPHSRRSGHIYQAAKNAPAVGYGNVSLVSTPQLASRNATAGGSNGAYVSLVRGDTITPEPIRWLWPDWLARGKMHILAGAAGTGKTTLALQIAATITTGGRWPDGTQAVAGDVLIWSGEDDPADTLIPRLIALGAVVRRVHFVGTVNDMHGRRVFDPASDVRLLANKLADCGDVALLIVDPIVSAVATDSHKNGEVRRSLQPLVDLAATHGCALIGITHYSKGTAGRDPLDRVTGSLAFGAFGAPRVRLRRSRRRMGSRGAWSERSPISAPTVAVSSISLSVSRFQGAAVFTQLRCCGARQSRAPLATCLRPLKLNQSTTASAPLQIMPRTALHRGG